MPRSSASANDGDGIISGVGSGLSLLSFFTNMHAAGGTAAASFTTGGGLATVTGYAATGLAAGLVIGTAINNTGVIAAGIDYASGHRVSSNDLPGGVADAPEETADDDDDEPDAGSQPSATGRTETRAVLSRAT